MHPACIQQHALLFSVEKVVPLNTDGEMVVQQRFCKADIDSSFVARGIDVLIIAFRGQISIY